ncbi:MAG: glycosyltransferase family 9 protein [Acidobacteriaceae bacterium]
MKGTHDESLSWMAGEVPIVMRGIRVFPYRDCREAAWLRGDLRGRRILLGGNGLGSLDRGAGAGDVIQAARFVSWFIDQGCKVTIRVPDSLSPLFRWEGVRYLDNAALSLRKSEYDYEVSAAMVPRVFPELAVPPAKLNVPEDAIAEAWIKYPRKAGMKRVGLVWTSSEGAPDTISAKPVGSRRSMWLRDLKPLASTPDCEFISLQHGVGCAQLGEWTGLTDACSQCRDFEELASIMRTCDAVVTIDTGPAHLSGSLGIPTLAMLPYRADPRWGTAATCKLYPSAKLYRQDSPGDWSGPVQRIAKELTEWQQKSTNCERTQQIEEKQWN